MESSAGQRCSCKLGPRRERGEGEVSWTRHASATRYIDPGMSTPAPMPSEVILDCLPITCRRCHSSCALIPSIANEASRRSHRFRVAIALGSAGEFQRLRAMALGSTEGCVLTRGMSVLQDIRLFVDQLLRQDVLVRLVGFPPSQEGSDTP
jgi:hypothetical protein